MAKQTIFLGNQPNDGTGDSLRVAFDKVNDNFTELYENNTFDGSYESLTDKPTIPADINELTDEDGLLAGGNANTGLVTFNGVTISGAETPETGNLYWFGQNDEGGNDNKGASGVALPITPDSQQIQEGWIARFDSGEVFTVTSVWEQNNAINLAMNNGTGFYASLPVTVESPDWQPYVQPELKLKADSSVGMQEYGLTIFNSIDNDTHIKPSSRDKGVALGFAYGQGSHVRVEGTNGQWGDGTGNRVGIVANDGEGTSAEWIFTKEGVLNLPPNGDIRNFNGDSVLPTPSTNTILSTSGLAGGAVLSISTGYPNYGIGASNACFDTNIWTGNGGFEDIQVGDTVSSSNNWSSTITQIGIYGAGWLTVVGDWDNDPSATYTVTGSQIIRTVLDLTKTVHKLSDGEYTLQDGAEGQIIHLVQQNNVSTPTAITVYVDNARIGVSNYTNIFLTPFQNGNMITMIFTDGAWQSDLGMWD